MDDYDPACPTEDETQFTELDLSQVPLPPSLPAQAEGLDRDAPILPFELPPELGTEERKGRRKKKKKKRKHGEAQPQPEEDGEDDAEENESRPQSPTTELPHKTNAHEVDEDSSLVEAETDLTKGSDDNSKQNESNQEASNKPSAAPSVTSATSTAASSSVSTRKSGKLHFKLAPDPSGGKAKVSFQLKKNIKSTFQAADGNEEEEGETAEDEKRDTVEKTAAEEYVPTRFKVSKKHEMYRPSQIEPTITVVFSSPVINTGVGFDSSVPAVLTPSSSISQSSSVKSSDSSEIKDSELTSKEDARAPSSVKDKNSETGKEAKNSKDGENNGTREKRDTADSHRGLRRSARMENRQGNKDTGKDDSSRSTRRSSRSDTRSTERYENLRSSYSRRDRSEERQRDKSDKRRRNEDDGKADDKNRALRSRKNEHEVKSEEKRGSDSKQYDKDRDDKNGSGGKSDRKEYASAESAGARRTRSSQRNRSCSQEKNDEAHLSADDVPKTLEPEKSADVEQSSCIDVEASTELTENAPSDENCDKHIEIDTADIPATAEPTSSAKNSQQVLGSDKNNTDDSAEKLPHIQKIVIRRSVDSNDFEIARNDVGDGVNTEIARNDVADSVSTEDSSVKLKLNISAAKSEDSTHLSAESDDKKEESTQEDKNSFSRVGKERYEMEEAGKSLKQKVETKVGGRHRSLSSEGDQDSDSDKEAPVPRRPYKSEPPLPPEQVLVDVSALPGKSKWEMDDDDDDGGGGGDDEAFHNTSTRSEERPDMRDIKVVESRWPYQKQAASTQQVSLRTRRTESSGIEDDASHEHKRHREKKKHRHDEKTEKKLRKKKKRSSTEENMESYEIPSDNSKHKEKGDFPRSKVGIDNSKIVNYLKEYSTKEEKASQSKAGIDSAKLVTYLKEYSGKMTVESRVDDASDEVPAVSIASEESKDEPYPSEASRASKDDEVYNKDSQRDASPPQANSAIDRQAEQGYADLKVEHSHKSSAVYKRESGDESEEESLKEKSHSVRSPSRSSSYERSHKERISERHLKGKDRRSTSLVKEKRDRSSSVDRKERSVSKSAQKSKDRRNRSRSSERNKRSSRNRSSSTEWQDQSRFSDRRRGRRQSRSRSPAWRNRERRNRSRSASGDRRSYDRRERSWSRSRERNYAYRSYRSPARDSYGRTRRENRDRRGRSRSDSVDRTSDRKRHDDGEESCHKTSRDHKKSSSPDKKSEARGSGKSDAEKAELNVTSSVDLSSIPIPDEVPLPAEKEQRFSPDKTEKFISEVSDSQDESVEISDEKKETVSADSNVRDTKDEEASVSYVNVKESEDKESSTLGSSSRDKKISGIFVGDHLKPDRTSKTVNPATLPSGKDRQIKFSITGGSKKLKPFVASDIMDDDDDDDNDDDEENVNLQREEGSQRPPELAEVDGSGDSDKVTHDTSYVNESDQTILKQKTKIVTENVENRDVLETEHKEIPLKKAEAKTDFVSLTLKADKSSDSESVESQQADITADKTDKTSQKQKEMETSKPHSAPQKLKFKYIPLWEMEELEAKPVIEEVDKKPERGHGLGLDYESESSEEEEEKSTTKESLNEDDGFLTKKNSIDKLSEEPPAEKLKEEDDEEESDTVVNIIQDKEQEKVAPETMNPESSAVNTKEASEPVNTKEASEPVNTKEASEPVNTKEASEQSALKLASLQKCNLSDAHAETVKEAYSPSHPSLEDTEDIFDAVEDKISSIEDKPTTQKSSVKSASADTPAVFCENKSLCCLSASQPAIKTHQMPTVAAAMPTLASTFGGAASMNIGSIPLPGMIVPQVPQPVKPPGASILPPTLLTSLIGLQAPLPQTSLFAQTLPVPQPVPPPSTTLPGIQPSGIPLPMTISAPKPVPPPQLNAIVPQSALAFNIPALTSSFTAVPQVASAEQLSQPGTISGAISSQGITPQVQGTSGFQGALLSGHIGILPVPAPIVPLSAAVVPSSALPLMGAQQGGALSSLSVRIQSTSSSFTSTGPASGLQQHLGTSAEVGTSDTHTVKFRINRFHQGPSVAQAIPPPSVAIPPPSLALPSLWGTSSAVASTVTPASSLLPVQQLTASAAPQKPLLDQPVTTTHSKRPKISSILSQPKVSDPSVLGVLSVKDNKVKALAPVSEDQSNAATKLSHTPAHGVHSLSSSVDPTEQSDTEVEKSKPVTDGHSHESQKESNDSVDREDSNTPVEEVGHVEQSGSQSQLSSEDDQPSLTANTSSVKEPSEEERSASIDTLEINMENIPLPGETQELSSAPPKSLEKMTPPLPPSSPPHHSPPPVSVSDSGSLSSATSTPSKGPVVGSLLAERKKRFSQSPLAIGMLPKISLTQSPLAAGPLPKLPPEPEDNKNLAEPLKKKVSSPGAADAKSSIPISSAVKQKKPQAEKEQKTSKVHFVFKSKAVIQKTIIPGFEDEGSDDSDSGRQEAANETSHAESSILSLFAETKEEMSSATSSAKAVSSTEGIAKVREAGNKVGDNEEEQKNKLVSEIEAFPVQVITSSRKEEVTPASSWPEFTVGKKEKQEEDFDRDESRRSSDREDRRKKKRKRFSEKGEDREEKKRGSRYEEEEDKKGPSRKKGESRRSDDEDDDDDGRIRIKKEKDDYYYDDEWGAGQDYDRFGDRRKGHLDDEEYGYNKRRRRYDDDSDYRRDRNRDTKEDDKYSRRRSGDDREDNRSKRKYEDSRRVRHFERDRSRDRSRERERSRERDKHDGNSSKSRGKHTHRSRDKSHSRSPPRRRDRGRNRSRDRFDRDRDRSRSHSHERTSSSSSRKKDSRSFKEELLEELTKPSIKTDPKDELFKVAAISSSSQSYVPEYQSGPPYSGGADSSLYAVPHHGPEMTAGYPGQDPNYVAQYPPPYDHQQYGPHWQGQPVHSAYNQGLPPQHQDIHSHYPSVPPDQVAASHEYPYQSQQAHYPTSSYPPTQTLADPYHPVPGMLQQQPPPLVQHPVGVPQPMHIPMEQHGPPVPPPYPAVQHQVPPPYPQPGPPRHFHPQSFPPQTFQPQESVPPFTPLDFNLQPVPRPRTPLLPLPPRGPLLKTPQISRNAVDSFDSPRFSSPELVSSPGLQMQPDSWPQRKPRLGPPEEGTFSPVLKSAVVTSSSPAVGSPSASSSSRNEALYKNSDVGDVSIGPPAHPEPTFETSALAESEFDSNDIQDMKASSRNSISKKRNNEDVNEPTVSSSGVEDSTGDTGSDSGTDSSSQKPLKVKSRWRRNSEAEAVVDTSTSVPPLVKQLLNQGSTPNDTPDSSPKERRRTRSRAAAEELISAAVPSTETPPPPPPPRKRIKADPDAADMTEKRECEGEMVPYTEGSENTENVEQDLETLMKRPDFPKFEIITENIHLTERKRSKSMKRMLCDCTTSRDERAKGIPACGSDCLNRMLMIECGSRCPCGEYCSNKRFQKKQYSKTVPFSAGDKGWGLRAEEDMEEKGTFIMEYVGELLDYEEFVRRTRQYSKAGLVHHYFMALNADEVVDATLRGSISRFINHSCDPNCETQKWTVNGELRVGFFTKKPIKKGEELTFDYQFEHYGEAQKCYCGAENCRGYIGLVKSPTRNNKRKEKKKREIFKDELLEEDIKKLSLLDGMRNKNHVLELCRLMVRAEKVQHRIAILKILQDTTESACLRLFLDYHGLPLFWSWMADIGTTDYSAQTQELKLLMLSVLKSLPISNRTALRESKIPDVVERWAVAAVVAARKPPPPPPPTSTTTTVVSVTTTDSMKRATVVADNEADVASSETAVSGGDEAASMEEDGEKAVAAEPEATTSSESSPPASPSPALPPLLSNITPVSILASAKDSRDAKRKRRVTFAEVPIESQFSPEPVEELEENDDISSSTQSTEHKEGLEGYVAASGDAGFGASEGKLFELKPGEVLSSNVADSTSFDRNSSAGTFSDTDSSDTESLIKDPLASLAAECISLWSSLKEVFKIPKKERVEERKRTERELDVLSKKELETSDPFANWKRSKVIRLSKKKFLEDDERKPNTPKMSKEERRQLFEAQVKAEDELAAQAYAEEYQRQQEAYVLHQQRLLEDPQYFYFHQQQQGDPSFAGIDPNMVPPEGLIDPVTGQSIPSDTLLDPLTGQPVIDPNTGQPIIDPNTGQPLLHHHQQIDPNSGQPVLLPHHVDLQTGQPLQHIDPHTGQPVQHLDPLTGQPIQHLDPLTGQPVQHIDPHTGQPLHHIDPLTGQPIGSQIDPITGQPIQLQMDPLLTQPLHPQFDPHLGLHQHSVQATSDFQHQPSAQQLPVTTTQSRSLSELELEEEVPPPPSPPTVPVTKLPPNWKTAKDAEGRVYYYHAFTRQTQWEMPNWEENDDDSDDMDLDPLPADEIIKAKKKTTTAAADTSSEVARKIKDQFRSKMSNFIVAYLNPYRKQDCKIGRIVSTEDFKHLARKLTHHVMSKELKHCRHVEDLEVNENVKAKAKDYVRKYMSKFGTTFKKSSSPHPDESTV